MITKNIIKQPKSQIEIAITVPWADLEGKWNETLTKLAADLELPGFRKGQVPLSLAEQNLGSKLNDEFFKIVMPHFLIEALNGENIIPIDYPKYQLASFAKDSPLSFKAQITEKPQITVGDYKNIRVQRPALKQITDDEVSRMIGEMFKRWKARLPGEQAKNPANSLQQTGNSQNTGASGSVNFNPPIGGPASQPWVLKPDDNFARAVGVLSLADLKTKLKNDLEKEAKYNNELDFEELILQQVEAITTVDLPEILILDELNRMMISLQRRVADMGLLLDDYLKSQNKTLEGLKNEWRPQAEKNVRMELGLSEIARAENVQVADQELQAEVDKIQDAKLKAQFEADEPRLHLKHSLRQIKTLDRLKNLVANLAA